MTLELLYIYVIIHILYIAICVYLFSKISKDIATHYEFTFFRIFQGTIIFYIIACVLWTLQEYGVIVPPLFLSKVIACSSLTGCSLCSYTLFLFSMVHFHPSFAEEKRFRLHSLIPQLIVSLLTITSIWTGLVINVNNERHVENGPIYIIIPILMLVYFLFTLIYGFREYTRSKSYVLHKKLMVLLRAMIFIFICVIVDAFFPHVALIPTTCIAASLILYINLEENRVYTDALTNMNNRRRANEYIENTLRNISPEKPLYLYMCDLNSFKIINDKYGHSEGDFSLIVVAEILKEVVDEFNGFAARFGGDEFVLCYSPETNDVDPKTLITKIQDKLTERNNNLSKPYEISISIGYTICDNPKISFSTYLNKADLMLYRKKDKYYNSKTRHNIDN